MKVSPGIARPSTDRIFTPQVFDTPEMSAPFEASSVCARKLMQELSRLGAESDAARGFPRESLKLLRGAGIDGDFDSAAAGDRHVSFRATFDWLRFVGRADLSLGRLFEGHVNAVQLIGWYGTSAQRRTLRANLDAGKYYGVWATEPPPGVQLLDTAEGYRLQGRKSFASGAGHIDFAIVTAQGAAAQRAIVIVPANDPQRADLDGWQVRGMRATMSGGYDLTDLRLTSQDVIGEPGQYDAEPRFTAGAWRFAAVQLGGIEALVAETRLAMSPAARNDPLQRLKFAEAVEAMRTAYFWVEKAARLFENGDADAPSFVRMARGVVERCALDVMTAAARIVGTRSAFDGQRIDKITRDLSLYLRQAGPDHARDQAALAWLERDIWDEDGRLW